MEWLICRVCSTDPLLYQFYQLDPQVFNERKHYIMALNHFYTTADSTIRATIVDRLKAQRQQQYQGIDASCWHDKAICLHVIRTAWALCMDNLDSGFQQGKNHPAMKL